VNGAEKSPEFGEGRKRPPDLFASFEIRIL